MVIDSNVIIKLTQSCMTDESISAHVGRVTGLIDAHNFHKLMGVLSIDSNPREPKESSVTKEIISTLTENPDLFHLMSKGILVSTSSCSILERGRLKLSFVHNNYALPGILDGGHNTFAIAKHLLSYVLDGDEQKVLKDWKTLLSAWKENADGLKSLFSATEHVSESTREFNFLIPIEIIFPRDPDDSECLEIWGDSHRQITHARNNNVQLTDSTKDNHQGFYDELKMVLPDKLVKQIEWKTNDGGIIKVADIVALALVPLSKLDFATTGQEINLVKIYNSKQTCVDIFREILNKNGDKTGQMFVLKNDGIKQALSLVPALIEAYDQIYKEFPDAYNSNGGKFGRIEGVRIFDPNAAKGDKRYSRKQFTTKFHELDCDYNYADGFIIPLVVGLRELIGISSDTGKLEWQEDPKKFFAKHADKILNVYGTVMRMSQYDPQKIGKDKGCYELAGVAVKSARNL